VRLDDEQAVHALLADTLFRLWGIVNNLTRLRPSRRERYRVTIFGSARTRPGDWVYEQVREMSTGISALGCDIVTGGGPGLMEAANRGAKEGQSATGGSSIGIRVHLPFEQSANPFVDQNFEHSSFFTRLQQFVLMSDAYVLAPGGIGTLLEAVMVWQLLQVHHIDAPLVFAGPMWKGLVEWVNAQMLRPGFELVNKRDMQIPQCVDDAAQAVAVIAEHHCLWTAAR
jgi:uncharacterized protein (TIGR00730 family)